MYDERTVGLQLGVFRFLCFLSEGNIVSPLLTENSIVHTLWIGGQLSLMEQLTIKLLQSHGHQVQLWSYDKPMGVPDGTILRNATEILPASSIFRYTGKPLRLIPNGGIGSLSHWSDQFQLRLLHQEGGSADAWPGFALFLGTVQYLATQSKHPVNYPVGATAVLENNPKEYPKAYELLAPNGEMIRVEADEEALQYPYTQQPGQYRLRGVRARGPLVRGFSVNIDRDELSLKSVNRLELEAGIGREQLLIAKSKDEVQSSIGEGRYGRDLSPFLWVMLAMMVMAEQTMSSRFYGSRGKGKA